MKQCRAFYTYRRSESADQPSPHANYDKSTWDADVTFMSAHGLHAELERIEHTIRKHRDIASRERTVEDDCELYHILPEQVPADFRLPNEEEFLGTKKEGAGCPNFWKSHNQCSTTQHNLYQWGPCR